MVRVLWWLRVRGLWWLGVDRLFYLLSLFSIIPNSKKVEMVEFEPDNLKSLIDSDTIN